jgi:hypothetical protein
MGPLWITTAFLFWSHKPLALHAVASSTLKHRRAGVLSADGRKFKHPASRADVGAEMHEKDQS